jgi:hypothetical protein
MFRKSIIALVAIAGLATAFSATEASARGGRWHGGWHGGWSYRGIGPAAAVGIGILGVAAIAAATAPRCFEVVNRFGEVRTVCR